MMLNALTIDVEEYFHVHAFADVIEPSTWDDYPSRVEVPTRRILDMLAASETRATFFVLGWVARRHPRLLREIVAAGHELASHGYWHQRVDQQSPDVFRSDVRLAKKVIENAAGCRVSAYRAPSFSITEATKWAHEVLVEEGYATDSSQAAGRRGRSIEAQTAGRPFVIATPSGPLWEFPLPAGRFLGRRSPIGGGGYLRLFPYAFTRQQLQHLSSNGEPFCVYLHPWELDPEQPRVAASWKQTIRHRIGLRSMPNKLARLMSDFSFDSLSSAISRFTIPAQRRLAA